MHEKLFEFQKNFFFYICNDETYGFCVSKDDGGFEADFRILVVDLGKSRECVLYLSVGTIMGSIGEVGKLLDDSGKVEIRCALLNFVDAVEGFALRLVEG